MAEFVQVSVSKILIIVCHLGTGLLPVYNHFRVKLLLRLAIVCSAPPSPVRSLSAASDFIVCLIEHFSDFTFLENIKHILLRL